MVYSWTDMFIKYEKGMQNNLSSTISSFYRAKDSNGDWAIHIASKRGHKDLVKKALDEGSYVNLKDAQGNFPLQYAARYGFFEIVCMLIDKEAAVHLKNKSGSTAFSLACEYGHLEVVKYLLTKGAQINDLNNERESPLMLACKNQHLAIVKILIENGANISINSHLKTRLLSSAVTQRNYELVELLLSREIKPEASDIMIVCRSGDLKILKMFSEHGIDLNCSPESMNSLSVENVVNPDGTTQNHTRKKEATKLGDIATKYGLNFNGNFFEKDLHGNSFLHRVVERGIDELVFQLVENYSNIDLKNNAGLTPFAIACEYGYLEIAKHLYSIGANMQTLTQEKESPLSLACKQNQIEMSKWLIENGAYVNLLDKGKKSILFHVYKRELYELAEVLLASEAKFTQDIFTEACQTSRYELLKVLLKKHPNFFFESLDVNKNLLGQTLKKGDQQIVPLLLNHLLRDLADRLKSFTEKQINQLVDDEKFFILSLHHLQALEFIQEHPDTIAYLDQTVFAYLISEEFDNLLNSSFILKLKSENEFLKKFMKNLDNYIDCKTIRYLVNVPLNDTFFLSYAELKKKDLDGIEMKIETENNLLNIESSIYYKLYVSAAKATIMVIKNLRRAKLLTKYLLNCRHSNTSNAKFDAKTVLNENNLCSNLKRYSDPVQLAFSKNQYDVAKYLVERGNKPFDKEKCLILACDSGQVDIFNILITQELDLNCQDENGFTPLLMAIHKDKLDLAKLLLDKGVNVNIANKNGLTPLACACKRKNKAFVELLIKHGALINRNDDHQIEDVPLINACSKGHMDIVKLLLKNGALIESRNKKGTSAFLAACSNGHENVAKLLMDNNKNNNIDHIDNNGDNAISVACQYGKLKMTKFLTDAGIDLNVMNKQQKCPLFLALEKKNSDLFEFLLEKGANLNQQDKDGQTVLFKMIAKNKKRLLELLFKKGIDLNIQDKNGNTALHFACVKRNEKIVSMLLEQKPDLEIKNKDGYTALDLAILKEEELIASELIDEGAKIDGDALKISAKGVFAKFLCSQSYLSDIELLIRDKLAENFYSIFKNLSIDDLKEKVIQLIDHNVYVIGVYLNVFKSMRLRYKSESDLRERGILKYFTSLEFKERFLEDILNNLKEQKEIMEIGIAKIEGNFSDLCKSNNVSKSSSFMKFKELKELVLDHSLLSRITDESNGEPEKQTKAQFYLNNMIYFILKLQKQITLSEDLFKLLTEKKMVNYLKKEVNDGNENEDEDEDENEDEDEDKYGSESYCETDLVEASSDEESEYMEIDDYKQIEKKREDYLQSDESDYDSDYSFDSGSDFDVDEYGYTYSSDDSKGWKQYMKFYDY